MTENNENREEVQRALNAPHDARAELRAVHPEGTNDIETTLEGPAGGLLSLYSAITQNLLESLTKQASVPPLVATKMILDAAMKGLTRTIEKKQ